MTERPESEANSTPPVDLSLELALRAGRLGTWRWEIAEDRLTWSKQLYELFGYTSQQVTPTSAGFLEIIHPDDRVDMHSKVENVYRGSCTEWEHEFRIIRGDNRQVLWTYGRGVIERDDQGTALRITAVASDITDRKRWEHELEHRESHLRRVIDNVLFFVGILDVEGTLLEANAIAMKAGGVSSDEIIGKKFWDCYWWSFNQDTQRQLEDAIRRASKGEVVRYDVDIRMAGGARTRIDFMLSPVRDDEGKITHLIPSGVDISERIKAEQAAIKREGHLSLAQEAGKLGSWVWDITAGQITWSDQLHEMYGYGEDAFKGTPEGFLEIVFPEDRKIVQNVIDSILNLDSEHEEFECRCIRGTDGQIIWTQVRGAVDRDAAGKATRIAGFAVDITDRKRREVSLAFFADLQLVVANLSSAEEIVQVASERVATFLQLSRCLLIATDEEAVTAEVFHDHHAAGLESLCGVYTMSDFVCEQERLQLKSGRTLVINDTSDPSRDVDSQTRFAALSIGAIVDAPCLQDQNLKFLLAATKEHAYRWRSDETELLQELATRIYLWIERARAEDALLESERTVRESEELLQLAIDVADFSIGRIDYVNNTIELPAEAARLYGFGDDPITVTREQMHAVFYPDDRRELNGLIDHCISEALDGRISMEHRVVWPSGEVRWLNIRKQLFFDHNVSPARPLHAILVAQDITERKNSELSIRLSEERLRTAAQAAGFGMVHVDLIHSTVTYSEEFRRLVGMSDESGGRVNAVDAPQWVHPDDRGVYAKHYQGLTKIPEGSTSSIDHRIVRPDGEVRWVRLLGKPQFSGVGAKRRATQVIGTLLDITPQHQFEESLKEARALAEAANEAKSAFLANMSHEIRTPMTAILGYTDLISEKIADEETLAHVRTIRSNGDFLLDIINDILDLSKIEAGKFEISRRRFSPDQLVEEVRSIMDVRATESKLGLNVEYRGAIPVTIESDPKRLRQILINLVGNAIKFTPSGHVKVVVSYKDDKSPLLQFDVVDTGIGMNDEQKKRLFQPFSQGDGKVNRQFGGTGLGLAISKRLTEMLGGEIAIESSLGEGSTFSVTIATGSVEDVQIIGPQQLGTGVAISRRENVSLDCHILVVDDRRDIRFLSKSLLAKAGATVSEAEDGEVAVGLVNASLNNGQPYDLILLDMQMPRLDGYQTAEELRRLGFAGPIIALTADAMQGDMVRCIESGCNDYLSKPIDKAILLEKVGRYVSGDSK